MTQRLTEAEDLYRFKLISGCHISPDGDHVIFSVQRIDPETEKKHSNLWVVSTQNHQAARQFTYGDQADTRPLWSPDGSEIAFISNRGAKGQAQLYIIPFHGGEARPVTHISSQLGRFVWSPDGRYLVFTMRRKDAEDVERENDPKKKELGVIVRHTARLIYKEDGAGFLPQERWHLWRVDLQTGEVCQLTPNDIYDEFDPHVSPDGKLVVFRSNRTADPDLTWDAVDLFTVPIEGGEVRKIPTTSGPKRLPRFSPDGRWIAYYQEGGKNERWRNVHLWIVPADGSGPPINLTKPFDFTVEQATINDMGWISIMPPAWSNDSHAIIFQVSEHGDTILRSISFDSANPTQTAYLNDMIAKTGVVENFSLGRTDGLVAYKFAHLTDPGQLHVRDFRNRLDHRLSDLNRELLDTLQLGQVEELWFKGPDDNDLQGWLITPPHFDENRQYPAILQIHGGPLAQYGNAFFHEFQLLAAQGYVVFFCNPRGGLGYGDAHAKATYNDWGNRDYADLMAFTDLISQRPYIDTERLGVTGGSYGGFMTNWIISHTHRFKAAVTQRSLSNMISMAGTSDLAYRWESLFGAPTPVWEDVENHWRQSPLKYVAKIKTPTLIIHNEQDLRCGIEQGEQFFVALRRLGVETELVRFPDETHDLSRSGRTDRRVARLRHILSWFDRYLKVS